MKNHHIKTLHFFTKLAEVASHAAAKSRAIIENRATLLIIVFINLIVANTLALSREVHEAHTHGTANLTLAIENGIVEVEFEAPAASLLGFEHKPKTEQQIESIENVKAILNSPTKVLAFAGANCTANSIDIDIHGPAGEALKDSHKQDHDDHDEDHHDSDEEHHKEGENHSEVSAIYLFECVDGKKIKSLTVSLFEHFSDLEKVNVNWVTEDQQGEGVLQSQSPTVELK